jgi:phosphatidylglycerophosphate synthase
MNKIKYAIPLFFTLTRFLVTPFIIYYLIKKKIIFAFTLFFYAIISDFLDGYFARNLNVVTFWGALLDPLSDKFFFIVLYIFFYSYSSLISSLFIYCYCSKEITLLSLGALSLFYYKNKKLMSFAPGKYAMGASSFHLLIISILYFFSSQISSLTYYFLYFIELGVILINLYALYFYICYYYKQ